MRKRSELRDFQIQGYNHILKNDACGLFMDMGLGKTATVLTAISDQIDSLLIKNALVISTKSIANTVWEDETNQWEHLKHLKVIAVNGTEKERIQALKQPADIYTISIDLSVWLIGYLGGSLKRFSMLVLDESSLIKNPDTVRFKTLRKAFKGVRHKVLMTGTPTPNSLLDLWTQIFLLDNGVRLYPVISKFRHIFGERNPNGFGFVMSPDPKLKKALLNLISDICLSINAKDYGMKKEIIEIKRFVKLDPDELARYKKFEYEAVMEFLEQSVEVTAVNAAVLTGKLMQYANGGMYYKTETDEKKYLPIHDGKIEALSDVIDEINSNILLACHYKADRDRVVELCKKKKLRYEVFSSQNQKEADRQIKAWNAKKIDVFIVHPKSGGHGLNLQFGGHYIVWFGVSLSVEQELQFNARLARTGQIEIVRSIKLVTHKTVEEKFIKRTQAKKTVQEFVLEYLKDFS